MLFKLVVKLTDYSEPFRNKLYDYCLSHPSVTCFIRSLGPLPIEIEVEVEDYPAMNMFVEEFRKRFDSGIAMTEILLIKRDCFHRFPAEQPKLKK